MQLELFLQRLLRSKPPANDWLTVNGRPVRLRLKKNRRARRYILRLRPDGSAQVTVPRGGSEAEARAFAGRQTGWLRQQLDRLAAKPRGPQPWVLGSQLLFRGELVTIEVWSAGLQPAGEKENGSADIPVGSGVEARPSGQDCPRSSIQFGLEVIPVPHPAGDLRSVIQAHLRALAARELPPRVLELAARCQLSVQRVLVRNQRTRWGSCSRRRTISLNWRLIQVPPSVCDYLILHELMHLRQMNHSRRFWREVEQVCPDYRAAEKWLKQNGRLLRD